MRLSIRFLQSFALENRVEVSGIRCEEVRGCINNA